MTLAGEHAGGRGRPLAGTFPDAKGLPLATLTASITLQVCPWCTFPQKFPPPATA
jgi:hypothetical protein